MSEVTEKYYDDWICIWNEDYSKIPSLISDDFVGHWPTRDIHGPSELESIIKMTRDCFLQY
ncbi:hypothetical protein MUO14_21695 [Halobacillus shinanisalinarum]|uniref:SnoaL-like domain-containing protein n=1 Tax=Halobacillus shinanisalinarum TaxID=2932258 RepID=A0ABY4GXV6_9BACI|nr:hypothetical protein [Halobacillus shinanisalinarum]UOQ92983.1 hypothetical protein MUO14_21695 [Halobacillus shinanisalinarum]